MSATALARVRRGAKALDAVRPGWAEEIDTSTLDVSHIHLCPLGQLFRGELGAYTRGLDALGLYGGDREVSHGFDTDVSGDAARRAAYARLTECWLDEIARRTG